MTESPGRLKTASSQAVQDDSRQPSPDAVMEQSVRALLLRLHKAFSAKKMYDPGHPARIESLEHLWRCFDSFFEVESLLALQLTESEILYQGLPVYQELEKRGSLLFMLFNDGVREICFEAGLSHEEIGEFVEALRINASLPQEERDMVGLFWARGFHHIQYLAVEEIPDQEIECIDAILSQLESRHCESNTTEPLQQIRTDALKYEIGEEEKSIRPPFSPELLATARSVCREEMEARLENLALERAFDGRNELVRILFDVLHLEDNAERSLPVLKLLDGLLTELVHYACFDWAIRIFGLLEKFGDHCRINRSSLGPPLEEMLRSYSKREKLSLLGRALQRDSVFDVGDLSSFVALLQPIAIEPLGELMEEIADVRVRSAVCQGLESLSRGQASRLAGLLSRASEIVARDIIGILRNFGDSPSVEILKSCTSHSLPAIRREAVKALQALNSPQTRMAILPFLQDEDEGVRTAAAESLELLHWPTDAASLCEMVRQPSFHRRSLREKRALLSILGRMGTEEGLQILENFLRKKSLFHRQQHEETRRCAELARGKIKPDSPSGFPGPSGRDSSKRCDRSASGLAYHSACAGDNRPSDLTGAAPSA